MKPEISSVHELTTPQFLSQATFLNSALQRKDAPELSRLMAINDTLAARVKGDIDAWNNRIKGAAAALTFRGDIYSGLSAGQWNEADAVFAQTHLLILSGLYGLLRPFDAIKPYRLEMGYKLELDNGLRSDTFWEQQLTHALNPGDTYINLTAAEYFKVIKRQLSASRVISPKFLTVSKKTNQPVFVTVHAKIARGSFANWLIQNKIDDPEKLSGYNLLNYRYDKKLSTELEPVFVCKEFRGLGLSVRLK
jgi:uncharacterized protein